MERRRFLGGLLVSPLALLKSKEKILGADLDATDTGERKEETEKEKRTRVFIELREIAGDSPDYVTVFLPRNRDKTDPD